MRIIMRNFGVNFTMAQDYTVQDGDCMSSIAYKNGFFWKTLWNLPNNAALKAKRKNPNVLMTGDVVHIPDLTVKQQSGATGSKYKFKKKGVPEKLNIQLLDYDHKPRPNLDYVIVIDGNARRGKTNANGVVKQSIPPNAMTGKLTFAAPPNGTGKPKTQVLILQLGGLNPLSEVSGLKARLTNLGFYKGPINENLDDATRQAISAFQAKKGLPVTGIADDATRQKLQDVHGH
jgi:Putative peptidoglycan binding domain